MTGHAKHRRLFDDLSNELLHEIVSHVQNIRTLYSLSLTSRRLHAVTEEYLYAKVVYVSPTSNNQSKYPDDATCTSLSLFLRSVCARPELWQCIKSVSLDTALLHSKTNPAAPSLMASEPKARCECLQELDALFPADSEGAAVAHLLHLAKNASSVALKVPDWSYAQDVEEILILLEPISDICHLPESHGFTQLDTLHLDIQTRQSCPNFSTTLEIPTLRSLSLHSVDLCNIPWHCPQRSSLVTKLRLESIHGDLAGWQSLLGSFAGLVDIEVAFSYAGGSVGIDAGLADFMTALQLQSETLERFYSKDIAFWPVLSFHKCKPTLSDLKHLKFLAVCHSSLVDSSFPCMTDALKRLLPPKVERLRIRGEPERIRQSTPPSTKDWETLVQNAPFLKLKEVQYIEHASWDEDPIAMDHSWSRITHNT